jgi:hypothetical protein
LKSPLLTALLTAWFHLPFMVRPETLPSIT